MSLTLPYPDTTLWKKSERVQNSAAAMDYLFPGWADKINLNTFDIKKSEFCVIGQAVTDGAGTDQYVNVIEQSRDIPGISLEADLYYFYNGQELWEAEIRLRQQTTAVFDAVENSVIENLRAAVKAAQAHGYVVDISVTKTVVTKISI